MLQAKKNRVIPTVAAVLVLGCVAWGSGLFTSSRQEATLDDTNSDVMARLNTGASLGGKHALGSVSERFRSLALNSDVVPLDTSNSPFKQFSPQTHIEKKAKEALDLVTTAAREGDKGIFDEIAKVGTDCTWCNEFYDSSKAALKNPDLRSDERAYIASVLARSGTPANVQQVVQLLEDASNHPEQGISPNAYEKALEEADLPPEAVDQISADLSSNNPYLREAAVSILTKQGTLEAVTRLYEHTLEREDPRGYYGEGIGIGRVRPKPEAINFLTQLASNQDQYSHLAIKALLNSGRSGLDSVVAIMSGVSDYQTGKNMLRNAVDHVGFDTASISYMESLSRTAPNRALKEWAGQVVKEHQIGIDLQHKEIEYNENFDKGIIR